MPSDLTSAAGGVLLLFFVGLVLHSLWQWGRRYPPVTDVPPAGVEGGLMVLVSAAVLAGLFNLTSFGLLMNSVRFGSYGALLESRFFADAVIPGILGFVGYLWAAFRLLVGRKGGVKAEAAAGFFVSGPAVEAMYLSAGTGDPMRLLFSGLLFAAAAAYLFFSRRALHTYG